MKRMIGLMFREKYRQKPVHAFYFYTKRAQGIWMRNMHFPIDVAMGGLKCRAVDIKENFSRAVDTQVRNIYA